jgi:hypothetical protein
MSRQDHGCRVVYLQPEVACVMCPFVAHKCPASLFVQRSRVLNLYHLARCHVRRITQRRVYAHSNTMRTTICGSHGMTTATTSQCVPYMCTHLSATCVWWRPLRATHSVAAAHVLDTSLDARLRHGGRGNAVLWSSERMSALCTDQQSHVVFFAARTHTGHNPGASTPCASSDSAYQTRQLRQRRYRRSSCRQYA